MSNSQVFTSISGKTVSVRVVIDPLDVVMTGSDRWEVVMSAKTDHGLGSTGVPDYPYYVDHFLGNGNVTTTRTLIPDRYVVELALRGQGIVDFSEFVIAAPVACNLISNCGFAINADSAVLGKGSCNGPLIRGRLYSVAWVVDSNATGPFHVELWSNYGSSGTKDGQGDISGNSGYFNVTFNEPVGNYIFNLFITSCGKTAQCGYNTTCSISEIPPTLVLRTIIIPSSESVEVGKTVQLTATCKDQNGNVIKCPSLKWGSGTSDTTIDDNGVVTGISSGAGYVNCWDLETGQIVSNICIVTIKSPECTNPKFKCSGTACIPDECDGTGTFETPDCNNTCTCTDLGSKCDTSGMQCIYNVQTCTWDCQPCPSGSECQMQNGLATCVSSGNGGSGTGTGVIGSITIDKTISVDVGKSKTLTAACKDNSGNVMTCPSLIWQSDNEDIAKVIQGVVTGVSAGETIIIAKDSVTSQIVSNDSTITVAAPAINLTDWLQTETCLDKTNKKYCAKNWMWGGAGVVGLVLLTRKKG